MKRILCVSILVCILLSSITPISGTQSYELPDTKIRGTVTKIQYDYQGYYLGVPGTYKLTAFISVLIGEIPVKPETFTREVNQLVGVSYNYTSPPVCKVNDTVEVNGLWIHALDLPMSLTIQVHGNIAGSYVAVLQTQPSPPPSPGADGQGATSIDTEREYSNGSISTSSDGQVTSGLWYDWVDTNGTQVIFFAYYSKIYNSPVITFLGQHYKADNETEVFMANTLMLLEAYNDTNKNDIPDFTPGESELQYNFIMNASVGFSITPIQKLLIGNITHYTWGVTYETIDGFFLFPENRLIDNVTINTAARAIISHIGFSYDYYIQSNVSYLKTSFDVGRITELQPSSPNLNVSLNGLSLSLFYGTSTLSTKPYTVIVNEQPYNSTVVQEPAISNNETEVRIQNKKAYEFLFGQNYTLFRDSGSENHQSKSAASSRNSVPSSPRVSLTWVFNNLQTVLHDLFPRITSLPPEINLDYEASTLLYRVCYPVWDGCRVLHDPTYIAYFYPTVGFPTSIIGPPFMFVVLVAVIGVIVLAAALVELRRTKGVFRMLSLVDVGK